MNPNAPGEEHMFYNELGGGSGGIIGPLVGAGAMIYDASMRSKDVKRQIAAQKAEAELAYQRSQEMWHWQNAYNSPIEQMKRFGAAGLNPHLIYGQGSAGLASSPPSYQPPNIQMRGASPPYGAAIQSILPTLMAVGSWMQNMRASEVQIQSGQTNIQKAEQLIAMLEAQNPMRLRELENKLSLYPYQRSMQYSLQEQAQIKSQEMERELQYKFGVPPDDQRLPYGGTKALEYYKKLAEMKLKAAQASWTDFNVTNPQALIQMVLGGVMGMAGQTLRFNQKARMAPVRTAPRKITTRFDSKGRRVYQRQE